MEGSNTEALLDTMEKLRQLIQETCNRIGTQTDVILAGGVSTAMTSRGGGDDVPPQEAGRSRPDHKPHEQSRSLQLVA